MNQYERGVQREIVTRLRPMPLIAIPVPNSIPLPRVTEAQRKLFARIVNQMKEDGQLEPGALDLSIFWPGGGGMLEIKAPAYHDLRGRRHSAGTLSAEQRAMLGRAAALGINYGIAHSWDETVETLRAWGAPDA